MELPSDRRRPPEDFDVPYPSRNDPDIQSLLYSKLEFRECASGPDPFNEHTRVDDTYFNSQILFARLLDTYGSMMLLYEQSSGKSGCFKAYHKLVTEGIGNEIDTMYYVSADLQGKEFEEQIVFGHFGDLRDKQELESGRTTKVTIGRRAMRRMKIIRMTYGQFAAHVRTHTTKEKLIHTFCRCAVIVDEFHQIKLTEKLDAYTSDERNRLADYKQFWILTKLCPTCVFVLASGTPITDNIIEFIYHFNLLPNTKQIQTQLSVKIATEVCDSFEGLKLSDLGLEPNGPNWAPYFDIEGPAPFVWKETPNQMLSSEQIKELKEKYERQNAERMEEFITQREIWLESIGRGRIMYIRAPQTSAVVRYMDDSEIRKLNRAYLTATTYIERARQEIIPILDDSQVRPFESVYRKVYTALVEGNQPPSLRGEEAELLSLLYEQAAIEEEYEQGMYTPRTLDVKGWRNIQYDDALRKTFTNTTMSMFQTLGYIYVALDKQDKDGLYVEATQSCVVVFPSKEYAEDCIEFGIEQANRIHLPTYDFSQSYGGKGFNTCFEKTKVMVRSKPGTKNYAQKPENMFKAVEVTRALPWFLEYLKDDALLQNCSSVIWDIVWLVTREEGFPVYVPSKNKTSVLQTTMAALKARGYEEFTGKEELTEDGLPLSKGKRVAMITPKQSKTFQKLLAVWGHPKNVTREYIACLLVSPAGTTGLNIPNAGHCCVTEPQHNSANTRQAVYRVLRPNSHLNSVRKVKGPPWLWDDFPVYMHYYMPDLYGYGNTDELEQMKSLMKGATNSYLVRDLDSEFTNGLWTVSHWKVYSNAHEKEVAEASLFRTLKRIAVDYPMNIGRNIRSDIIDGTFPADFESANYEAFNFDPMLPLDTSTYDAYYLQSKKLWKNEEFLTSLSTKTHITSMTMSEGLYTPNEMLHSLRRVVELQLAIGTNRLGFPLILKEDHGLFYPSHDYVQEADSSLITYTQTNVLTDVIPIDGEIHNWTNAELVDDYKLKLAAASHYKNYLTTVPNVYKCTMIEEALLSVFEGKSLLEWESRIIDAYKYLYYCHVERGDECVIIHQVNNLHADVGSNYVAVGNVVNPKKNIRMYVVSSSPLQCCVWRGCTNAENLHYGSILSSVVEDELRYYYEKFEYLGFMGIIVRGDKVHIRYFERVKQKKGDSSNQVQYKSSSTGQNVKSIDLADQLHMLYELSPERHTVNISENERQGLLRYFHGKKVGKSQLSSVMLNSLATAKLEFYREMHAKKSHTPSIPRQICDKLLNIGAMFAIVGDAHLVVSSL